MSPFICPLRVRRWRVAAPESSSAASSWSITSSASASPAARTLVLLGVRPVELSSDGPGALLGGSDDRGANGEDGASVSIPTSVVGYGDDVMDVVDVCVVDLRTMKRTRPICLSVVYQDARRPALNKCNFFLSNFHLSST